MVKIVSDFEEKGYNWLHFHFPFISCFSSCPQGFHTHSAAETLLSFQLNLKEYNLV